MTKIILICLLVSLPAFAQTDELTLESTTAPTVVEESTATGDSLLEEPTEAPDSPDVTENISPDKEIPATAPMELSEKSAPEVTTPAEMPESTSEMADSDVDATTPNPTDDENKPTEEPEKVAEEKLPEPEVRTPVITTEAPKDDRFINHQKSHWLTTFGFEGMKYKLPFDFEGTKRNVRERDQELYGARFGLGGQIYLGYGFFTTSTAEVFYLGTLFTKSQEAGPQVSGAEAGHIKRTSGFYGGEISQSFGRIFEFRSKNPILEEWVHLTFEPFVEAGLGAGQSYNKVNYHYDTGTSGTREDYKRTIRDTLTNARVGAGFNMTSRSGFFLQVRATVNRFDISKRKIDTYERQNQAAGTQTPTATDKNAKMDPVTVFTLGGGYKF